MWVLLEMVTEFVSWYYGAGRSVRARASAPTPEGIVRSYYPQRCPGFFVFVKS